MQDVIDVAVAFQPYGWLAFGAAVALTPLVIRVAQRFRILDIPDQKLKPHARPIPYLGGTAICVAWCVALGAAMFSGAVRDWPRLVIFMSGGLIMCGLGLIDDLRSLSPRVRLIVGGVVIAATLAASRTGLRLVDAILGGFTGMFCDEPYELPALIATPLSLLLGTCIVLGACNSSNLIDGLDGLCSGVMSIISFGFFLLAAHLAAWDFAPAGDPIRLTMAIAMFGATLGFLPWNFNPARVFMGDAGSVLLGYNCGMLIVLFSGRVGIFRWVVAALMIFSLPLLDTALAMYRRWRSGRPIFQGDRSHFYDQLVQRGLSVRRTALICYALTVVYALAGLLMTWVRAATPATDPGPGNVEPVIRTRYAVLLYLVIIAASALLASRFGLTRPGAPTAPRRLVSSVETYPH